MSPLIRLPRVVPPDRAAVAMPDSLTTGRVNHGTLGSLDVSGASTFAFWACPYDFPNNNHTLFRKGDNGAPFDSLAFLTRGNGNDGDLRIVLSGSSDLVYVSEKWTLDPFRWAFICCVVDSSLGAGLKIRVWVGELDDAEPHEVTWTSTDEGSSPYVDTSADDLTVGNNIFADAPFNGAIARAAVWSRALPEKQARALFRNEDWRSFDPVMFSLYELPGNLQRDISGNGHDGTVAGSTLLEPGRPTLPVPEPFLVPFDDSVAAQSVSVGAAPLVAHAPSVTVTPGAVSRSVSAASLVAHAPAVTVTPGAVSRSVTPASAVVHAPAAQASIEVDFDWDIVTEHVGPQSASVASSIVVAHAPSVTATTPGNRTVSAASVIVHAPSVGVTPGAVSRSADPAPLLAHAPAVTVTTSVSTSTSPASLIVHAPAVTVTPGAVSRSADSASLVAHAPAVTASVTFGQTVSIASAVIVAHAPAVTSYAQVQPVPPFTVTADDTTTSVTADSTATSLEVF